MSWDTQAWAAKQRPGSSSAKLLLLALASCADADHCCYPSVAWLEDFTDLNRKTIISTLDRLAGDGLIVDTGERKGRTKQVKVYRLAAAGTDPKAEPSRKGDSIPKAGPLKSPDITPKESQKRDTEPFKEPTSQKATPSSRSRATPASKGPLPDDWKPEPFSPESKSAGIMAGWDDERLQIELEKFRANHTARDSRFTSWQQAWATWVLNSVTFGAKRNATVAESHDRRDGFERALDRDCRPGPCHAANQAAADRGSASNIARLPRRAGS